MRVELRWDAQLLVLSNLVKLDENVKCGME